MMIYPSTQLSGVLDFNPIDYGVYLYPHQPGDGGSHHHPGYKYIIISKN
jgi:hypothetical protein